MVKKALSLDLNGSIMKDFSLDLGSAMADLFSSKTFTISGSIWDKLSRIPNFSWNGLSRERLDALVARAINKAIAEGKRSGNMFANAIIDEVSGGINTLLNNTLRNFNSMVSAIMDGDGCETIDLAKLNSLNFRFPKLEVHPNKLEIANIGLLVDCSEPKDQTNIDISGLLRKFIK